MEVNLQERARRLADRGRCSFPLCFANHYLGAAVAYIFRATDTKLKLKFVQYGNSLRQKFVIEENEEQGAAQSTIFKI